MSGGVGSRIRRLRVERGKSQSQLADEVQLSGSYLSLIESGRRPASPSLLQALAARLGCSVEFLQTGRGGTGEESLELDLRFAEIALRNGDTQAAEERFSNVALQAEERDLHELRLDAKWGLARTCEAQGRLEEAIEEYESLTAEPGQAATLRAVTIATALCRAYSECGDLNRAIEVGESALGQLESDADIALSTEAAVALTSTLVGCYYERGDLTRAHSLAATALARAEEGNSPMARAAALWNAGMVAEARGDVRTARSFLDRALALYSEGDNLRAVALLKIVSAWLKLRQPDPPLEDAERLLLSALADLPTVGSPVDIAYGEIELARCRLLEGDWEEAVHLAQTALTRLGDSPRIESARARLILGHATLDSGNIAKAVAAYTAAADQLRRAGAQRQAASAWRELAESLVRLGRTEEALDAYRQAADAAGVSKAPERADRSHTASRRVGR